jgi:cytochrome c553
LAKYGNFCASCHTANVGRNVLNVTRASTLNGLNAAISGVGVMRSLGSAMSAQDKLDVSAYINSAK